MLSSSSKVTWNLKALCSLFVLFAFSAQSVSALFEGCDWTYNINEGYSYLESPKYPAYYPPGTSCRYKFVAPQDYVVTTNCSINLDKGPSGCTSEFFYYAGDGDRELRDSEQFCGSGSFVRKSIFNSVVMAYVGKGSYGQFRCSMYAQRQPCDCGWSVKTKIVNGEEAYPNDYPSTVALRDRTMNEPSFCDGSIIGRRYILTAAHCRDAQPNPGNVIILAGRHNIQTSTDTKYAATYYASKYIVHPDYTTNPVNNDIAIIVTTTDIEYSRGVGPICLPPKSSVGNSFAYDYVYVNGWGTKSFSGQYSATLQQVYLMITDNQSCAKTYQYTAPIFPTQICTYDTTGTNKDSCQHDSGGPVILKTSRQYLLGIISFGLGCGQGGYATGVNTRVTSYLDWIYQNTAYSTCQKDF